MQKNLLPIKRSIPQHIPFLTFFLLSFSALLFSFGCSNQKNHLSGSCGKCHDVNPDINHQIECSVCHNGNTQADTIQEAHKGMVSQPAHPDNLQNTCGKCHQQQAEGIRHSQHFTLHDSVNLIRRAFGAKKDIDSLTAVPIHESIDSIEQLSDDLLRRRCLRCHLYSNGDDYSATQHATGCAACHMSASTDNKSTHVLSKTPNDNNCLSCHYGNRVGFDYYGRSEHDFNEEYRTPYTLEETTSRPYGVDYHQLSPDIHQVRGLICIDCHGQDELMTAPTAATKATCASCHAENLLIQSPPAGVKRLQSQFAFTSSTTGKEYILPVMQHPAHKQYTKVDCQVCHGQWFFNDTETHLLRSDLDEYDHWTYLTVQGSSEIEKLLKHNLNYDNEELPPETTDKITGDIRLGVWYKGYTMRRWETPLIALDENGVLKVMRPVLNLTLSWIDDEENIRIDNYRSQAPNSGMRPYTPHTTGPAGMFYQQRLHEIPR